jgi:crotonobetainyl-CoA:carnitine CoA-transferase CaiB-like acyl-CoA transferase
MHDPDDQESGMPTILMLSGGEKGMKKMLAPYRVLDLTDEESMACGKILADMGADVIQVEKEGGALARHRGPFYHDTVDPNKSLLFWVYNTNKRSITLDIETAQGKDMFKRLVKGADVVIE